MYTPPQPLAPIECWGAPHILPEFPGWMASSTPPDPACFPWNKGFALPPRLPHLKLMKSFAPQAPLRRAQAWAPGPARAYILKIASTESQESKTVMTFIKSSQSNRGQP